MSLRFLLDKLLPAGSLRNVAILTGGTTTAQAISILFSPILTRLYNPDDFGLLAIYAGLLAVFSSFSSFCYEMAIPLPDEDDAATAIVLLSLVCVSGMAIFIAIILFFWGEIFIDKLNAKALMSYLWLLPVGILLAGAYQVFSYWIIRTKCFAILAETKVIQSVSSIAVQLMGYALGPVTLLFAHCVSQATGLTRLAKSANQYREGLFKNIGFKQIRTQAYRYKRFPLYSTWGRIFNVVGAQLPPILFAALFTPAVAGLYALANRVLSIPISLVGQSIGQVYFSKAAEARKDGVIGKLVSKNHDKLSQLAMPPALCLAFLAPELFSLVFGTEWHQAGVFVQWLTPMLYFQFIISPISQTLSIMERQELGTILQFLMLFLRVLALVVGAWFDDVLLAVLLFSIWSSISYVLFLIVTIHIVDVAWVEIIKPTAIAFLWGIIAVSPLCIINFFEINNQAWMLFSIFISFAIIVGRYISLITT